MLKNDTQKNDTSHIGLYGSAPWGAFVRFENSSLPRIWKVSNLGFIFNILFRFMLNKMMVTGVKLS